MIIEKRVLALFLLLVLIIATLIMLVVQLLNNAPLMPEAIIEMPDSQYGGAPVWNGFELVHEDYFGREQDVFVPENVLTADTQTLTVFFTNSSGSDAMEFGVSEFIQVKLDGAWYTLPFNLAQRTAPLILPPFSHLVGYLSEENRMEHTVDLSGTGGLPPGQYRLVEKFFWQRLKNEYYALAYFWVTGPGGERPPESEISGSSRMEDITLSARAISAVRRSITDKDDMFFILIENLSGKSYEAISATLEKKQGNLWTDIGFKHANLGLIFGWGSSNNMLFLNKPLAKGEYRLRLLMRVFGESSEKIEPEYMFSVIAYEEAPEPKWDPSILYLSRYDAAEQSASIALTLKSPVLNAKKTELEFVVTADYYYSYGDFYEIEVLLGGKWYGVPFAHGDFNAIGYMVVPDVKEDCHTHSCNPVIACGILPAGQYRMIKEFDLRDPNEPWDSPPITLAKEFVIAEFMVEETLDWLVLQ
jgi:hypothetical protein